MRGLLFCLPLALACSSIKDDTVTDTDTDTDTPSLRPEATALPSPWHPPGRPGLSYFPTPRENTQYIDLALDAS